MVFGDFFGWFNAKQTVDNDAPSASQSQFDELLSRMEWNIYVMVTKDDVRMRNFLQKTLSHSVEVTTFTDKVVRSEYIPLLNCYDLDDVILDEMYLKRKSLCDLADSPPCIWVFDVTGPDVLTDLYYDIVRNGKTYGINTITITKPCSMGDRGKYYDGLIVDRKTLRNVPVERSVYGFLQKSYKDMKEFRGAVNEKAPNNRSQLFLDMQDKSIHSMAA